MVRSGRTPHGGRQHAVLVFAAAFLAGASPSQSSTVAPVDIVQVVQEAVVVVHATAISSTSHWNDKHSLIVTDTQFQVHETLQGAAVSSVTVRVPGGQIGKLLVEVPGMIAFAPGAETVLALARDAHGALCVAGGGGGRWDVETQADRRTKIVRGPSLRPTNRDAQRPGLGKAAAAESPATLSAFLQDLRERVRTPAAPGGR